MGALSGKIDRARVILVHKDNHHPVFTAEIDPEAGWAIEGVPPNEPFMAIYTGPDNCRPEIHGPYWAS